MMIGTRTLLLLLLPTLAAASEGITNKSVIGPQNTFLADGNDWVLVLEVDRQENQA